MKLYTTWYHSPLGQIKLQCNDQHLQAVLFGDDAIVKEKDNHEVLEQTMQQLDEYFAGKRKTFSLPINQTGTDFQQKVWDLLYQIPFGKTISYNELSKHYGNLKAIRAVAAANGKNKICIIVPCHRVIGSNQSLTGYAGGIWRKKWLLEHEAKYSAGVQMLDF